MVTVGTLFTAASDIGRWIEKSLQRNLHKHLSVVAKASSPLTFSRMSSRISAALPFRELPYSVISFHASNEVRSALRETREFR